MGVKQSKRSVDITETSTKGEIEGFGNEGKVEKIVDGVVEKIAANGHVDNDLQNPGDGLQNGLEHVQNGEAAAIAAVEKIEGKEADEGASENPANGQVDVNGEANGEVEKSEEEGKKADEKKEKKKEKKEKGVKKKFSLRNFSFSKKDKSKPAKEEKSPEKVDETPAANVAEKNEANKLPEETIEVSKTEEIMEVITTPASAIDDALDKVAPEILADKKPEIVTVATAVSEDMPPPLPASPPPSEPADSHTMQLSAKAPNEIVDAVTEKLEVVTSSVSSTITETLESTEDALKNFEQAAIETGKQIEEKATSLLKTVEKRAEESVRGVAETMDDAVGMVENALGLGEEMAAGNEEAEVEETVVNDAGEEMLVAAEVAVADALAHTKAQEVAEKVEEIGGEETSSADMTPKNLPDLAAEVQCENPNASQTVPAPPPPVEAAAE